MRAFVRMFGLAINWDAYRELEYSVKTGRRAMEKTLPEGIWSYLGGHPETNSIFNAAMLAKAQSMPPGEARTALILDAVAQLRHALALDPNAPHAKNNIAVADSWLAGVRH